MADVRAFRGFRYDLGTVGALSDVVAPPYDVIDPTLQKRLYDASPYNAIRVELTKDEPGDSETANKYTRAASTLKGWLDDGAVRQDTSRNLYVYEQTFSVEGQTYTRRGFLARVRLEPFGTGRIFPHEQTLSGPKADRLKLYHATNFNISPVFGLYPAVAQDDTVLIYKDESRTEVVAQWHGLRQQHERPAGKPNYCLSDFIADKDSGVADWIGAFAVSAGRGLEPRIAAYEAAHDDYHAIMLKALADRFAEAGAEWLHQRVRREYWAYAADETLDNAALIAEKYSGIRPAPGYPACPDHTAKGELFRLINPQAEIGLEITETFAMYPAAAVSGFYLAHPDAHYFAVSKIGEDQMQDWAGRAGFSEAEAKRWLAPIL
jgi:hypothetical protein